MTTINGTILEVQNDFLLICDNSTSQKVLVRTPNTNCFCVGDNICVKFNGIMTMSLPPQINATLITKIPPCRC